MFNSVNKNSVELHKKLDKLEKIVPTLMKLKQNQRISTNAERLHMKMETS